MFLRFSCLLMVVQRVGSLVPSHFFSSLDEATITIKSPTWRIGMWGEITVENSNQNAKVLHIRHCHVTQIIQKTASAFGNAHPPPDTQTREVGRRQKKSSLGEVSQHPTSSMNESKKLYSYAMVRAPTIPSPLDHNDMARLKRGRAKKRKKRKCVQNDHY